MSAELASSPVVRGLRVVRTSELADYVSDHDGEVFWLTFQDGQMIEICRQYRP